MLVSSLELCADLCETEKFAQCEANHLSLPLRITGITQKQNKKQFFRLLHEFNLNMRKKNKLKVWWV